MYFGARAILVPSTTCFKMSFLLLLPAQIAEELLFSLAYNAGVFWPASAFLSSERHLRRKLRKGLAKRRPRSPPNGVYNKANMATGQSTRS